MGEQIRLPRVIDKCLANPLDNVGRCMGWSRYMPFQLRCATNTRHHTGTPYEPDDKFTFVPYHKSYDAIWAAIKWGYYAWLIEGGPNGVERFVLDMFTGKIVWQNYNKEESTYYTKGYGKHY